MDETPLPRPVPHHVVDPTSRPYRISSGDLDLPSVEGADTRPGHADEAPPDTTGLAQAARRISGLISDSRGVPVSTMDLAEELDTRQRPRIPSEQLRKLDKLGNIDTSQVRRLSPPPEDILPQRDSESDLLTQPVSALPGRGSDDVLTPPPRFLSPDQPREHDEELTQPRDRVGVEDDD